MGAQPVHRLLGLLRELLDSAGLRCPRLDGSTPIRTVKLHHSKRALAEGVLAGQDGGGMKLGSAQMLALLRREDADANIDAGT